MKAGAKLTLQKWQGSHCRRLACSFEAYRERRYLRSKTALHGCQIRPYGRLSDGALGTVVG
jgi:hypothetical protein